jgi:hypothetical protein
MTVFEQFTSIACEIAGRARFVTMATILMSALAPPADAAQVPSYAACRAMVMSSPIYLGGKESSLACAQPCEAAIQRCMKHGGDFYR